MTTISMSAQSAVPFSQPTPLTGRTDQSDSRGFQRLARLTGVMFLITYATSIPPVLTLYVPALSDPAIILGGSFDRTVSWGALLELLLILSNIATAVSLYPVL